MVCGWGSMIDTRVQSGNPNSRNVQLVGMKRVSEAVEVRKKQRVYLPDDVIANTAAFAFSFATAEARNNYGRYIALRHRGTRLMRRCGLRLSRTKIRPDLSIVKKINFSERNNLSVANLNFQRSNFSSAVRPAILCHSW